MTESQYFFSDLKDRKEGDEIVRRAIKIVGVSFNNRQAIVTTLTQGQSVKIVRESENPHDSNAIRVETMDSRQFGYIPREQSAYLAERLDAVGGTMVATVSDKHQGYDESNVGVTIQFDL